MLLFLSREDADAAPPVLEPLELHEWLTEHLRAWEHHPRYSDFQIDMAPNGEHWANAHDGLLGQAVNNLLENACKYSVPGSALFCKRERMKNKPGWPSKTAAMGFQRRNCQIFLNHFFVAPMLNAAASAGPDLV